MRDRMERFVVLPFSVGCVSASSVDVAVQGHHSRRSSKTDARFVEEDQESLSSESMKYPLKFLAHPKADISTGFHRLFKSFKTFSQLFAYKEEMEELKGEEMEIGFPTDVKHVTHIGCDSSISTSTGGWENLQLSPEFTLSSLPLGQYDLSMVTQPPNLVKGSA
ncbi:hypothetical protein SLEP1_g14821 [Rubroshorea leprosula]|uniref:CRIB domain-containing protein n=1 Tax=Rubroshorea leprosula TaxID=152421 RepID=A0AAV5IPR2_9ROSI|nr:hypothetical protein SLEP1_g14821 [Rubroshorea leprosula]